MRVSQMIPEAQFAQFHDILCNTGGRYVSNPTRVGDHVYVYYEPGDRDAQLLAWDRATTPLRETHRSVPLWRNWWRNIMLVFRRG